MDALFNILIEPHALLRENSEHESLSTGNAPDNVPEQSIDPITPEDKSVEKLFEMTIPIMRRLEDIERIIMYCIPSRQTFSARHQRPSGFANIRVLRSLNELCMPVFRQKIFPDHSDLSQMAREVAKMYPKITRKQSFSVLRKWFRKHRDENGQKVFAACSEILVPLMDKGLTVDQVKEDIEAQGPLSKTIKSRSNLEISDEAQSNEFIFNKIQAFLNRRVDKAKIA